MRRNIETIMRRVREELRAEGPDGAGYSDFIIIDAINSALDDLSGVFTIRDEMEFTTETGVNTYDLKEVLPSEIVDIIRVEYDGVKTRGRQIDQLSRPQLPQRVLSESGFCGVRSSR